MKEKIGVLFVLIVFCVSVLLAGCADGGTEPEDGYTVYYTTSERVSLTTEVREISGTQVQEIAYNILAAMTKPEKVGDYSLFPTEGMVNRINRDGENLLGVYMTEAYGRLSVSDEVLLRAGIVRSLVQLDGIDYVSIYVNEQPLTDAGGNLVGIMSSGSFLDSRGENLSNYEQVTLTLYFGDSTGTALVETEREMVISSSYTQERQVISALLQGPEESGLLPTMPSGTNLLSVSVRNRVCYVNFSSSFLTGNLATSPYITIYSLVNSLTELSNISEVQIMVGGDSAVRFRESIALDVPFKRNLDYIQTGGK